MDLPTPIPKIDSVFFIVNYDERVCSGGDHYYDDNREKLFHSYDNMITWMKERNRPVIWIKRIDKHLTLDVKSIRKEVNNQQNIEKLKEERDALMYEQEELRKKLDKINSELVGH